MIFMFPHKVFIHIDFLCGVNPAWILCSSQKEKISTLSEWVHPEAKEVHSEEKN